MLKTSKVQVTN